MRTYEVEVDIRASRRYIVQAPSLEEAKEIACEQVDDEICDYDDIEVTFASRAEPEYEAE